MCDEIEIWLLDIKPRHDFITRIIFHGLSNKSESEADNEVAKCSAIAINSPRGDRSNR